MMRILFREGDEIYFNEFDYPNACSFEELQATCPYKATQYNNEALADNKLNIICGSFYMIGQMKWIKNLE